ncbi:acyloxyacyl hydrolase [Oceaniglobus ichthyenteri]|uniref:acyloxyacyl hydrolase n=1 Tax=Oceaniglobus ichthyenteri TaxID=2136177 RepID=UPI000D395784|nr:acyloxyacyl hydrolase [Oceaniglobus ichthyenteri]
MTKFCKLRVIRAALAAAILVGFSGAGAAQSIDFGLTSDLESGDAGLIAEYHAVPFFQRGAFSFGWGVAGRIDADGDAWVGVGVVGDLDITNGIFAEVSFMPGIYNPDETILGGNLQFRSLIGLGARISDSADLILSVDHISNGDTNPFNPGMNSASLRVRTRF